MTLPTIYRSTSLENVARGWKTHEVDMSAFIAPLTLQVGANSIYGGGYATPTQSWWSSSRYYMITDRWNIELTYTDASGAVVSENITSDASEGYYPTSASDAKSGTPGYANGAGGEGGVASWHCNYYAYSYGPTYTGSWDGYLYNIRRNWPGFHSHQVTLLIVSILKNSDSDGAKSVKTTTSPGSYPWHYWSYRTSTYSGWNTLFEPPEGYIGGSDYNVCVDRASRYSNSAGDGARMTFPIIDITELTNQTDVR